jgi:hypothetical protein
MFMSTLLLDSSASDIGSLYNLVLSLLTYSLHLIVAALIDFLKYQVKKT